MAGRERGTAAALLAQGEAPDEDRGPRPNRYYLGHDLGTGGNKAVLVDVGGRVAAQAFEPYPISYPQPHWAEQDPEDWWRAVATCTRRVLAAAGATPDEVAGVGFAGQMLAMAPLDRSGRPTRPAISWLDGRATQEATRVIRRSGGRRVVLAVVGALPSGKDIVCKIAWIKRHEPDVYRRTAAFCDATGYLVSRATGELLMDHTAGGGTGIVSKKTRGWSRPLAWLTGTALSRMPPLRPSTDVVGGLLETAADDLALRPGTPVIAGMGDVPAAAVGSGALAPGDAHLCLATSSWVCVSVPKPKDLGRYGIFSLASADPAMFVMIAENETAGACLTWFAESIGVDEPPGAADRPPDDGRSVYAKLDDLAARVAPGADGLVFAPWLFGERAPFTETDVRGAFVNLSLEHGRAHLARAVLEGVALNLRWSCDVVDRAGFDTSTVRVIGGGARSDLWLQLLADATGRTLERVANPQEVGAVGVALAVAVGLGDLPDLRAIKDVVAIDAVFMPDAAHREVYDRQYEILQRLRPALVAAGRRVARHATAGDA